MLGVKRQKRLKRGRENNREKETADLGLCLLEIWEDTQATVRIGDEDG